MKFNWFKFFGLTILLISILILAKVAKAGEKSEWLNENPCMIKIITTSIEEEINEQKVTTVTKKEVMECKMDMMVQITGNYLPNFIMQI